MFTCANLLLLFLGLSQSVIFISAGGARGNYGYFTTKTLSPSYLNSTNLRLIDSLAENLTTWMNSYNLREFQYYDVSLNYSTPLPGWGSICNATEFSQSYSTFQRQCLPTSATYKTWVERLVVGTPVANNVSWQVIRALTDQVSANGGRSWLYVQSIGAEEPDLDLPSNGGYQRLIRPGCTSQCDKILINNNTLFTLYMPSAKWAERMVEKWAPAALQLGFDGIHWDQLGSLGFQNNSLIDGFTAFLNTTSVLLKNYGLLQTFNFVDSFVWTNNLVDLVEIPYWEVWTLPLQENRFYNIMTALRVRGVIVTYPRDVGGSPNNVFYTQCTSSCPHMLNSTCICNEELLIAGRWNKAKANNQTYLIFGNIGRRLTNDYFTGDTAVTSSLIALLNS